MICFDERYPFSSTGVDYLGPLLCLSVYGEKEKLHKVFIVINVCCKKGCDIRGSQ